MVCQVRIIACVRLELCRLLSAVVAIDRWGDGVQAAAEKNVIEFSAKILQTAIFLWWGALSYVTARWGLFYRDKIAPYLYPQVGG